MGRLEGSVALVTGAGSGIGLACAARFASEGAMVVGLDLNPVPEWPKVVGVDPDCWLTEADVRDEAAVESAVAAVVRRFGCLDTVLNAAGVAGGGPVHVLGTEEWDRVLEVNLKGTFVVCRAALGQMVKQRSGSIINVASIEGIEGTEGGSAYNASKGGVVMLTKNMAIDYGRMGIRANCICPGFVETPMTAGVMQVMGEYGDRYRDAHMLGRFGRPEEIAGAAFFLASDDSSFVTGHALVVDGGFTAGTRLGLADRLGLV